MRRVAGAAVSVVAAIVLVTAVVIVLITAAAGFRGDMTVGRAASGVIAAAVLALLVRFVPAPRLLAAYSALVYVILFAPIVVVIVYAFNGGTSVTVFESVSLRWFGEALRDVTITSAVERSARIALLSSLVSVTVGTAAAIFLRRALGAAVDRLATDARHASDQRSRTTLRDQLAGPGNVLSHSQPRKSSPRPPLPASCVRAPARAGRSGDVVCRPRCAPDGPAAARRPRRETARATS